jgi:hypothetical protein
MSQPQTFLFSTGVRPANFSDYPALVENQVLVNGILHIKFMCEDVPAGATFAHGDQTGTNNPYDGFIVRPIVGGGLASKFAYFRKPLKF